MAPFAFFDGLGFGELVLCGVVALLLFGGNLPEAMGKLGAVYRKLRRGLDDLKRSVDAPTPPRVPYRPSASTPISSGVGEPRRSDPPPPPAATVPTPGAGTIPPPATTPPRGDDAPPV